MSQLIAKPFDSKTSSKKFQHTYNFSTLKNFHQSDLKHHFKDAIIKSRQSQSQLNVQKLCLDNSIDKNQSNVEEVINQIQFRNQKINKNYFNFQMKDRIYSHKNHQNLNSFQYNEQKLKSYREVLDIRHKFNQKFHTFKLDNRQTSTTKKQNFNKFLDDDNNPPNSTPIITSHIDNEKIRKEFNIKNFKNLITSIHHLKETQEQFLRWFHQEKYDFYLIFGDALLNIQNKIDESRWEVQKQSIKDEPKSQYQYKIEKFEQQLEEQKKHCQQINCTGLMPTTRISSDKQFLEQNHRLIKQLQFIKEQLLKKDKLIAQMKDQTELLNEHIFDIEQKIEGIELEVETRLRERLKELQNQNFLPFKHSKTCSVVVLPSIQSQKNDNLALRFEAINRNDQKIDQLLLDIQSLKLQIKQKQIQNKSIQNNLKEQEKIITFREEQIKKNEEQISYQWQEVQKEKQAMFSREQELITAEENISKKISEIRSRQTQLEVSQQILDQRQAQINFREQNFKSKLQVFTQKQNQFYFEKQKFFAANLQNSLKISQNQNRKNIHNFTVEGGENIFKQQRFDNSQLSLGLKSQQNDGKNYRSGSGRQSSSVHQYLLSQISKKSNQAQSKSREKQMLRNNLNNLSLGKQRFSNLFKTKQADDFYQKKQPSNLDGLGSKVQKLREQIKREIQSIQ